MVKFTKIFKEKAIKLKEKGVHPTQIFEDEGIDILNKEKKYASKLINKWRSKKYINKISKVPNMESDILKRTKEKENKKRIEYLEAKVAYLEAENSFLVDLPKKKRN